MTWDAVAPGLEAYFNDEREIREAFWHPEAGEVVIDVGCAEGSYTIPALLKAARVFAVDPSAERLDRLGECARMAEADLELLTLVNEALFDGGPYPEHLHAEDLAAPPDSTFSTLDDLAERYGLDRLDWIKIDVEGAELGVLRGGLESLKRFCPRLIVEDHIHMQDGKSAEAMDVLLRGLGYGIERRSCLGPTSGLRVMWICTP